MDDQDDRGSNKGALSSIAEEVVARLIRQRAIGKDGQISVETASLNALRTQESRDQLLRDFVIAMMPDRPNPAIWLEWLSGRGAPFDGVKLAPIETGGERVTRALERSGGRVFKAANEVSQARRDVAVAEKKLGEAEKKLVENRAFDAAIVEHAVGEHLVGILRPLFAMGPAWTLMRAVSAHISAEQMTEELDLLHDQRKRPQRRADILKEREESTDRILGVLDRWCGDHVFEQELHDAIDGVALQYAPRERADSARRPRSSMKASVSDAESTRDRDEVLASMSRPAQ